MSVFGPSGYAFNHSSMMIVMDEKPLRKLKIENLTRCMNCSTFETCIEPRKEDVESCQKFVELPSQQQVIVVSLKELDQSESNWETSKPRCE